MTTPGASEGQVLQITLLFAAFVLWFLLPLVPALLIHRLLPDNQIKVDGPLQGLKVNASGGIASYLLLVLIAGAFLQSRLVPSINGLDDGSWDFEIPVTVHDEDGVRVPLDGGRGLTVNIPKNPDFERNSGGAGYKVTLRATKVGRKLPTVYLVGHLAGGREAVSDPIDLDQLARESQDPDGIVRAPMMPLHATDQPVLR